MYLKIILGIVVIILTMVILLNVIQVSPFSSLSISSISHQSSFDNQEYLVLKQNNETKEELEKTTYQLALIRSKLNSLIEELKQDTNYLEVNFGTHAISVINDLHFEPKHIQESTSSYTINKKYMYLCLRQTNNQYSDPNTLMFVAIHELAHMISAQADPTHVTQEFHSNFENLLRFAYQQSIWNYVDYSVAPVFYCGINVDATPDIL